MKKYIIAKLTAVILAAAALSGQTKDEATIRVLLMTDDYGGYFHNEIDYKVLDDGNGFQIFSFSRDNGNPVYKGNLDVINTDEGILLVNEVLLEDYVRAVVPSEMPANYNLEALKAQAICARTYAYRQMLSGELDEYFAHVDDSVNYQVYNNQNGSDMTNLAVAMTKGLILTYENDPINAYFFSTSSGTTSTDEVWNDGGEPYLKSIVTEYDKEMPWYRWYVHFPIEHVNELLCMSGYDIGILKDIQVLERSQGGAVIECAFIGENGCAAINNEYILRSILSPNGLEIHRQDGSVVTDFSILPSAYIDIKPVYDEDILTGFYIAGGGYGHGVGMSQNGANEMAEAGYTYLDILNYYYQDISLDNLTDF